MDVIEVCPQLSNELASRARCQALTTCSGSPQSLTQKRYNGALSTKEMRYLPRTMHLARSAPRHNGAKAHSLTSGGRPRSRISI